MGHPEPLGAGPTQARAGRVRGADLPPVPSKLITWADGDFILANDKIALVIEDVGASDLYDPWGGRPVGMARVSGGKLIEPADYGELFLLTGRSTVVTTDVSVINDGSDGGPAVVRASGRLAPLPVIDYLTAPIFRDSFTDIPAAIDYVLAPGAEYVDIYYEYASPRPTDTPSGSVLHGFMYTKRTPSFAAGTGFTDQIVDSEFFALIDDDATSWAYSEPTTLLGSGISASGFVASFTPGFPIRACTTTRRHHARIVIGGPGLDGLVEARARSAGKTLRAITGTVTRVDGKTAVADVRVHATSTDGKTYLTRTTTDAQGRFTLHVPTDAAVKLTVFRRGDAMVTTEVAANAFTTTALTLPAQGFIQVTVTDDQDGPLPARVQVLPLEGSQVPEVPFVFGEPPTVSGRLDVAYPVDGKVTLPAPAGKWEVIVSRGFEYEIARRPIDVVAGETTKVAVSLERSVVTRGALCGDFHIHTIRSNDSADDGALKLASAVADGVELPVRSDHDYVASFEPEIEALGVSAWARGIGSIELTSMEVWGHMGVFPLVPDPTRPNAGAPEWQRFPTADAPDVKLTTLSPRQVFDEVRARPEQPVIIINHPRGGANYFDYVGFDPVTGGVERVPDWDPAFTLVEVFNGSGWLDNRDRTVADWFGLLRAGRRISAVGSSDSHGISSSPVGYPRTCIDVGTDDPRQVTPEQVRDRMAGGHSVVSGGIYVVARVGEAGPGDVVRASGDVLVDVEVQAPLWVDVTALDVVVDGTTDTISILPEDAPDKDNPVLRLKRQVKVTVAPAGSFAVFAAYGQKPLDPVHPGRAPFGVTNAIFFQP